MLLCSGVVDSMGAVDSGVLSDDSDVLSETELSSLEDDISEELVLVELWLVVLVVDDVDVEELLDVLLCSGVVDSMGAVDSGVLSDDSDVLSETELSSFEDDISEELVLVELWLVVLVVDDVDVEELLEPF